jgi:MFS family permease
LFSLDGPMSEKHPPSIGTPTAPANVTPHILAIVLFNFICYLNAGIPLAVVPGYVHNQLGFGSVVAGLAVSLQFFGTFLSRPYAGRLCDTRGSKPSVLFRLGVSATSGGLMLLTWLSEGTPWLSLSSLLLSRLLLGFSESLATTAPLPGRLAASVAFTGTLYLRSARQLASAAT